jgi:hypothetical protein
VTFPKWNSSAILSPPSQFSPDDNQPVTTNYQCSTSLTDPSSCKVSFQIPQTSLCTTSIVVFTQITLSKRF